MIPPVKVVGTLSAEDLLTQNDRSEGMLLDGGQDGMNYKLSMKLVSSPLPIKKNSFLSIKWVDGEHREIVKAVSVY